VAVRTLPYPAACAFAAVNPGPAVERQIKRDTEIMRIECVRQVDASERNAEGKYEWYYEYDIYRFTEGDRTLVARSYTDTSSQAHFLRFEVEARPVRLTTQDTRDPLLRQAAGYLVSIGKKSIEYFGPEGYAPLPTEA
jgi:hypothetical protein